MALFDASSSSTTTDSRQAAGDASQQLHGRGNKLIQGGTDLSNSKINTGIANSKITGTDLSKAKISSKGTGNITNVTVGDTASLTDLAKAALNAVTNSNAASNASLLASLHSATGPAPGPAPSSTDLGSLISNALAAAGIGSGSSSSATPGADSSQSSSAGLASWWTNLSTQTKILIGVGAALLLGALIYLARKS